MFSTSRPPTISLPGQMKIPFVDLYGQYLTIKLDIDRAIEEVIRESAYIGGKYVRQFEQEFAAYLGVDHCIGCANGTDAIELILKALGVGEGDEVIVPAATWISTSEAVTSVGATPVFVDVDLQFYTIDAAKIEEKITTRTKAIIAVHLYGLPCEMDDLMELSRRFGLYVIEDCAQAHGAIYRAKKVGTMGTASAFSFYPGKNLGAYGDAGCVVTNDEELAELVRMTANHGQQGKHNHLMEGRNSRLDGIQAAVLSAKLPHLDRWVDSRRSNAATYCEYLEGSPAQLPRAPHDSKHSYHLFVVQVPARDRLRTSLSELGIETSIHYPSPIPLLPAYEHLGHQARDFPIAANQAKRLLSLPMYPELSHEMISEVCERLRHVLDRECLVD
jgi:dTDP-4-amino-4,6-dideoxygalactose transaminase